MEIGSELLNGNCHACDNSVDSSQFTKGCYTMFMKPAAANHRAATLSWRKRVAGLSPKQQELIRPILEDPRNFLFLSIRALASKLHTDTATLSRATRAMGFPGYPNFCRYVHELTITNATSLDSMLSSAGNHSEIPAHVRDSVDQDQKSFIALRNTLDTKQLARLAQRIWSARRIILLGGDLASTLVSYLEHHLVMLGLPVFSATSPGRVVHLVRTTSDRDLVMAISFHRSLRQTVEGMRQAKAKGAYAVGISDTFVSPIARFADECFICSVDTCHFGDSYVAPMALLNVVLVAVANYHRHRVLTLARDAAEEQQRGFRWYME
ncbi:MAG: MurR/RpiR family transcriptional regulator [Acidobacteria bacterium]|nr:MurR/RpiR family transcriptional regulator [Acidobacteriota bacterium]